MVATPGAMDTICATTKWLVMMPGFKTSPQGTLPSPSMSPTATKMNALLSKSITQTGGIPDTTTKTENGTDTHTTPMVWEPIFTGSNLATAAGGNLTTESKMVPMTGMMEAITGAIHGTDAMTDAMTLNHAPSPSMESRVMSPSRLFLAPLQLPVLLLSATLLSKELKLHSRAASMLE